MTDDRKTESLKECQSQKEKEKEDSKRLVGSYPGRVAHEYQVHRASWLLVK